MDAVTTLINQAHEGDKTAREKLISDNMGLVWSIAETFNGLMVIPNLIAVLLLSGTVFKLVKEYFAKK